jgi:hypothetical protein
MTRALRGDSQRGNEICLARADAELDVVWDSSLVQIKEGTTVKNRTAQQDNGQPDNEAGLKQGLLKKMFPMTRAGEKVKSNSGESRDRLDTYRGGKNND